MAASILEAYTRRITGLLRAASRARALALGSAAANEAMSKGAPLLLVATDAQAAAELGFVRDAVRQGLAVAWGTKSGYGEVSGRGEVAVVAVLDPGIADAVRTAVAVQQACVGAGSKTLDNQNGRRKKSRRATDGASDVERGA